MPGVSGTPSPRGTWGILPSNGTPPGGARSRFGTQCIDPLEREPGETKRSVMAVGTMPAASIACRDTKHGHRAGPDQPAGLSLGGVLLGAYHLAGSLQPSGLIPTSNSRLCGLQQGG